MRIAVFGSRSLTGAKTRQTISEYLTANGCTEIITAAEPTGVCHEAQAVARELSIPLKVYFADRKAHGKGMHHWRSVRVITDCDTVLFLHDGISKGTANEIKVAEKQNRRHTIIIQKPSVSDGDIQDAIDRLNEGT